MSQSPNICIKGKQTDDESMEKLYEKSEVQKQ